MFKSLFLRLLKVIMDILVACYSTHSYHVVLRKYLHFQRKYSIGAEGNEVYLLKSFQLTGKSSWQNLLL